MKYIDVKAIKEALFLMHRVELKVKYIDVKAIKEALFLMHRVELKVKYIDVKAIKEALFLMHRVELKETFLAISLPCKTVPNAPCGVESLAGGTLWQGGIGS